MTTSNEEPTETRFKLALNIAEPEADNGDVGPSVMTVLTIDPKDDMPTLVLMARGFAVDETGAADISDMLRDAADAIDTELSRPPVTRRKREPVVPKAGRRAGFNPQPRTT